MDNKLSKKKKGEKQGIHTGNDNACKSSSLSIYDERLRLLTAGYLKTITDSNNIAPIDIVNECALWIRFKLEIIYTKYYYELTAIPMEIYLDGFALNILNHQHIGKYQINYIKYHDSNDRRFWDKSFDIDQYAKENKSRMEHVFVTKIFEAKCLAFTKRMDIDFGDSDNALVQVLPIDKDDNVIDISEWEKMNANIASVTYYLDGNYNYEEIEKYWRDNIAVKNNQTVSVDEWIFALKKKEIINSDEFACTKLFYFILFDNGSNKNVMDVKDFENFICDGSFDEYSNPYNQCIRAFRKNIPNFLSDYSD